MSFFYNDSADGSHVASHDEVLCVSSDAEVNLFLFDFTYNYM